MEELLQRLILLLEEINNQNGRSEGARFVEEQFQTMENRYHTWMNYYSLFNGALLVAYCTLIVSTGKIVEKQCDAKTVYELQCGYWGLLAVIAFGYSSKLLLVLVYDWALSLVG